MNFKAQKLILSLLILVSGSASAQRIVNSEDEKIRLQGWEEHLREKAKFDRERRSDVRDMSKEEREWQKLKTDDLVDYRKEKIRRKKEQDDSGAEYLKDLAAKEKEKQNFQKQLDGFLEIRRKVRNQSRYAVKLTEEEELGLLQDRERFEWEKRNLLDPKGSGGGKRAPAPAQRFSSPVNIPPAFDSGPPPPPPAPDFDLDAPPPPPPPPPPVPEFSDGGFSDVPPPPPPPGGFEDQVPPPLFEEDF